MRIIAGKTIVGLLVLFATAGAFATDYSSLGYEEQSNSQLRFSVWIPQDYTFVDKSEGSGLALLTTVVAYTYEWESDPYEGLKFAIMSLRNVENVLSIEVLKEDNDKMLEYIGATDIVENDLTKTELEKFGASKGIRATALYERLDEEGVDYYYDALYLEHNSLVYFFNVAYPIRETNELEETAKLIMDSIYTGIKEDK